MNQSSNSSCLGAEVQLEVVPNTPNNYTYLWSPAADLDNPTISNPVLTPVVPGTFQYAVEVSSPLGCIKYDTIEVNAVSEYAPDLSLSTQNLLTLDCETNSETVPIRESRIHDPCVSLSQDCRQP